MNAGVGVLGHYEVLATLSFGAFEVWSLQITKMCPTEEDGNKGSLGPILGLGSLAVQ